MDAAPLNLALWPYPPRLLAVSNLDKNPAWSGCPFKFGHMPVVAYSGCCL